MLNISKINFNYRNNLNSRSKKVFNNLSINIRKGEFVSIFGPNGSGKSTLLNLISGIITPNTGTIFFENQPIKHVRVAYIFQNYRESLLPWLNVYENIVFPLDALNYSNKQKLARFEQINKMFKTKINIRSYPYELSGGQQQLVSIMRGLIINPDILLLDEPFSSLDYKTSAYLQKLLEKIWIDTGVTIIFVSHDIDEAILLSQRILVFTGKTNKPIKSFKNVLLYPRSIEMLTTNYFIKLKGKILKAFIKETKYLN